REGVRGHGLRGLAPAEEPVGQRVRKPSISVVQRRESPQVAIGERRHEGVIGRVQFGHCRQMYGGGTNADVTDLWRSVLRGAKKKNVPANLHPCPPAPPKPGDLAVRPSLNIPSDPL